MLFQPYCNSAEFSEIEKISFSEQPYYQIKVTDNSKATTIKMAQNGQSAHMEGPYDADSYKTLLRVYITTNNITEPSDLKPLRVPEQHLDSVHELIREIVNEHRVSQGLVEVSDSNIRSTPM